MIEPPKPYADFSEIESLFAQHIDQATTYVTGLIGRRRPRLTKKQKAVFQTRLRRFLYAAKPYLLALGALSGQMSKEEATYALLEGLLPVQLQAAGIKIDPQEDSFAAQIRLAARRATPRNLRLMDNAHYKQARDALWSFVVEMHNRMSPSDLQQLFEDWVQSDDAKRHLHLSRQFASAFVRFRWTTPVKLTDRHVTDLSDEYRTSSAFFEQRIRLLVSWGAARAGAPQPWTHWKKKNLKSLLDLASKDPALNLLLPSIDRHVRNALAHGGPETDINTGECRFADREVVTTWPFKDFYDRTRCLTLVVLAMACIESLFQLAQAQALALALWSRPSQSI